VGGREGRGSGKWELDLFMAVGLAVSALPRITYMNEMFAGAESFNQPLNNWNVSNLRYMNRTYYGATSLAA